MFPTQNINVSVKCDCRKAYDFISNPVNLPLWAAGLSKVELRKQADAWITESAMGVIKIRFAAKNKFGILDHEVELPSGERCANPFRVFANEKGCELIFTVFQRPSMSAADLTRDAGTVLQDLCNLKALLEKRL